MIRYLVQPIDQIFVKNCILVFGFLSFTKNKGRKLSSKYSQKLLDRSTDAFKTA